MVSSWLKLLVVVAIDADLSNRLLFTLTHWSSSSNGSVGSSAHWLNGLTASIGWPRKRVPKAAA